MPHKLNPESRVIRLLGQFLIGSFPGGLAGLGGDFFLGEVFGSAIPARDLWP